MKQYLNADAISYLADSLVAAWPEFDKEGFTRGACQGLEAMELKQRVTHIAEQLHKHLPTDFSESADILIRLADVWPVDEDDKSSWHSFSAWPLIDYAGHAGWSSPLRALDVLERLTPLFTAEFAMRPYLDRQFEVVYPRIIRWTEHPHPHVRRLASECIRPRLPWGGHLKRFQRDPEPVLKVLELLKDDVSVYVQKSVANNLNDISKDNPDRVLALVRQWLPKASKQRRWIIRHGLRSLIKQGVPEVFELLDYSPTIALQSQLQLNKAEVSLGDSFEITLNLQSEATSAQDLVIDYAVWHVKANGSHSRKVFKWKILTLAAEQCLQISKTHAFKTLSTRKYYPGPHLLEVLINGQVTGRAEIELRHDKAKGDQGNPGD
ncbi:DNA alkylation repair protein [Methylophaga lonarensis]|uniref:DNA alkylation repair protein n=1 Tax=Methylophaga lonarensis TaxID=999151 RepID=UPI003D2B0224